jgi:hypothetical protein
VSGSVWIAVAIVLSIVVYRAIQREKDISLSVMDQRFAKESIHEGLRCLGYATVPTSDNDAEAFQAGYERCKCQGMKALLAVSLVSSGMSAHYALNKKRDSIFCGVLALRSNQLLAAEFGVNDTELWDKRNALFGGNSNAKLTVEIATRLGLNSCRSAQVDEELSSALRQLVSP